VIVLDSSAAVDLVARLEPGSWVDEQLAREPDAHAPFLIDIEVTTALRKLAHVGTLSARAAREALEDFALLDLARYPHLPFLGRMWELRATISAADASFLALAEALDATVVTTDQRLARSHGHRAHIVAP